MVLVDHMKCSCKDGLGYSQFGSTLAVVTYVDYREISPEQEEYKLLQSSDSFTSSKIKKNNR